MASGLACGSTGDHHGWSPDRGPTGHDAGMANVQGFVVFKVFIGIPIYVNPKKDLHVQGFEVFKLFSKIG